MRVLIVAPYATVAPHFETELEIAERHQAQGDEVLWMTCQSELPNCDFNPRGLQHQCQECTLRRRHGWSVMANSPAQQLPILESPAPDGNLPVPDFRTVEELKGHCRENFDIGYGVLSSLVSVVRDPEPDLQLHRELVENFYRSAWIMYRNLDRFLARGSVDRVYVFNGRFAAMRAVFRACQKWGVACYLHERGGTSEHFELYRDHLPHDIPAIHNLIEGAWQDNVKFSRRSAVGAEWFENRRQRVEKNWVSFTKNQEVQRLPTNWDPRRQNIVLFTSSDDEFVAIGDQWRMTLFPNQLTGIQVICQQLLQLNPAAQVTVRLHPNLTNVDNATTRRLRELEFPNLTVVMPESSIDSYALMDHAATVVSFGSSIGIEAVYWRRPSVLLGPCLYQQLGGTYQPQSVAEVLQLLSHPLASQDSLPALKYGFWMNTHGIPYQWFRAESWYHGRYRNQVIYARPERLNGWQRMFRKLGIGGPTQRRVG